MLDQIKELEELSRMLEPGPEVRSEWTHLVTDYTEHFLQTITTRKAYNTGGNPEAIDDITFGENARPLDEVLDVLHESVDTPGINPASGGHIGYIPGGGVFPSALGDFMADVTNRYAGIYFANPGAVRMENQLIRWMCDLIGLPSGSAGNLASGGSIANLIGITTARDAKGIDSTNIRSSVVYINPQTHHCVHKAIRIAGLGECILREVPLDDRYRMKSEALAEMVASDKEAGLLPFLVVASMGSTDTGAVDPLDAIADICDDTDIWFQIDGAYGGFFLLVEEMKDRFKGVDRCDSFIIDPHKGMFLPYGLGAVLIRDGEAMRRSHYYQANYMQDALENALQVSPADVSPELTKHFRGLRMWLPMQLFGLGPFRAALSEKRLLALYFYERVRDMGFTVGPEPDLSVVIYRYIPESGDVNAFNKQLIQAVQQDGRIFISSTLIDGVFWLRLAVLCFRTHRREVDLLLEMLYVHRENLLNHAK